MADLQFLILETDDFSFCFSVPHSPLPRLCRDNQLLTRGLNWMYRQPSREGYNLLI